MNLYKIQKGDNKFSGLRKQPFFIVFFWLLFGVVLSWYSSSVTIAFVSFLVFVFLQISIKNSLINQTIRFYMSPQCSYNPMDNEQEINTICGFSYGKTTWNSAYIGWVGSNDGILKIYAVCYINGKRVVKYMMSCKVQTWVFANVEDSGGKYMFKLMAHNKKSCIISIKRGSYFSFYTLFNIFIYKLYPKIYGNKKAPINMSIYIKNIE